MGVKETTTKTVKVRVESLPPRRVRKGSESLFPLKLRRAKAGSTPPKGGVALGNCCPGGLTGRGAARNGEKGVSYGLRTPRRREAGSGQWS